MPVRGYLQQGTKLILYLQVQNTLTLFFCRTILYFALGLLKISFSHFSCPKQPVDINGMNYTDSVKHIKSVVNFNLIDEVFPGVLMECCNMRDKINVLISVYT